MTVRDYLSFSSDRTGNITTEVSIHNELNSLHDTYGPYIIIEIKDEQRRMCVVRCIYPFDGSGSFRIYLFLSRHYPIISQLFVRFKLLSMNNHNDERLKFFQTRIQTIFDETSYKCFYHGQLCLHICLSKIKHLFNSYYKQEKISSTILTIKFSKKQREESINSFDFDSPNGVDSNNNINNRIFDQPSISVHTNDSQISNSPSMRANSRTCGARFAGGTHLICFGRTSNLQQQQQPAPTSAPPILDGLINRSSPFHMRSVSLTVTKSRGSSSTDEQPSR